jgi:sterol desaturase/sphingolipid hydroxylase (fatty acid hydroxylase superfamily)
MDPFGLKVIFITFLVFVPLERLFALHPEQKAFRRDWANDLIFLLFNGLLIKLGLLAVSLVPVVALGFSEWAIGVYALLYQWQSVLIHSNVRFRFGPLRFLFASPEFHHWHHSDQREARDKNFAGQLSFLDALFGSLHLPRGQAPTTYGLDRPMPQRYVPQLLYPFTGDRIFQSKPDTAALAETMRAPD